MTGVEREDESLNVRLLADIKAVFSFYDEWHGKDVPGLRTATILKGLIDIPEAPWAARRLDANGLAWRLKNFRTEQGEPIAPTKTREPGTQGAKGYRRADFEDAWNRYVKEQPSKETDEDFV